MEIKIHNTASGQKEIFRPLNPKRIGMYLCGPTVYGDIHIGNARPLVVFDVFYRLLRYKYGENVTYVRNITDVDDKINVKAAEANISIDEVTETHIDTFQGNTEVLNCLNPTHEPRATEHIPQMIEIIEKLIEKGYAYADDEKKGHVFFEVSRMPEYGKFAGKTQEELAPTKRQLSMHNDRLYHEYYAYLKRSPHDFVLWKPSPDGIPGWENPWNERGRPGWHIECSAMSREYLGETFDLHMGGQDLIFPHHQNEIAQSCCAFPDSSFARYWMHNGHVTVEGKKMSKSLGNFLTVNELTDSNIGVYEGIMLRLLLLQTHYRSPLDFYKTRLYEAEAILDKFYNLMEKHKDLSDKNDNYHESNAMPIFEALCDDLNTPLALHHWYEAMSNLSYFGKKEYYLAVLTGAALLGIPRSKPYIPSDEEVNKKMLNFHRNRNEKSRDDTEIDLARKYIKATKQKDLELLDETYEDVNKFNEKYEESFDIRTCSIEALENALREAGVGIDDSDSEKAVAQKTVKDKVSDEIEAMVAERKAAKDKKDFDKADKIRDKLKAMGVELEDTPDGTKWRIKGH